MVCTDKPCPVTPEQRKQVRGKRGKDGEPDEVPWKVFATIVRAMTDPSLADETAIVQKLQDIAGFERLRTVLEQHFIRRTGGSIAFLKSFSRFAKSAITPPLKDRQARYPML